MAIHARKFRIRRVDMNKLVAFGVDLFKCFTAPLRENKMARPAVTRFDRHLAVGCHVFAVMAAEASIPILVPDKIGIRSPINLHFRERRENFIGSNASSARLSARSPCPKMRTRPRSWLSSMTACCRFTCQNARCPSHKRSK